MKTTSTLTALCRRTLLPAALRKTLAIAAVFLLAALATHADVVFNTTNFPDANFRSYLKSNFRSYGFTTEGVTITTANLKKITGMTVNCANTKGIEHFTELAELTVNGAEKLDLSKNTKIGSLYLPNFKQNFLDLSNNKELTSFITNGGNETLTNLNISNCTKLETIELYGNCYVDLSNKPNLTKVHLSFITNANLNLSNKSALLDVTISHAKNLTSVNLTNCTKLKWLGITYDTSITSLNLSTLTSLLTLDLKYLKKLKSVDVSKNSQLININCESSSITELKGLKYTQIEDIVAYESELTSLDVKGCTKLRRLWCFKCHLPSLDLSTNTALTSLWMNNQTVSSDILITSNTSLALTRLPNVNPSKFSNMKVDGKAVSSTSTTINNVNYHKVSTGLTFDDIVKVLWNSKNVSYDYETDSPNAKDTGNNTTKMDVTVTVTPYVACGDNNGGSGNFPDNNFRTVVKTSTYDKNTDGKLSKAELQALTSLNVASKSISKLNGIEYMKYLKTLNCSGNTLGAASTLPLTYNTELTNLNCSGSGLTGLDISKNTKLQYLTASTNSLSGTLGLGSHNALININVHTNQLTGLTLPSTKTLLQKVNCNTNQLTALSPNGYTAMTYLNCGNNKIAGAMSVASNSALQELYCNTNQLTGLTLPTTKTALLKVNCSNNQITALSPNGYTAMTYLNCGNNKIAGAMTVASNSALQELYCNTNQLTGLTLPTTKTALQRVSCHTNQLTALSANGYTAMTYLNCGNNKIAGAMSLTSNTKLEEFYCYTNQITSLDLTKNIALTKLQCHNNRMKVLDLSKQASLTTLNCSNQTSTDDLLVLSNTKVAIPRVGAAANYVSMSLDGTAKTMTGETMDGVNYQVMSGMTYAQVMALLTGNHTTKYNYNTKCATTAFANQQMDVTLTTTPYVAVCSGNFPDANFRTAVGAFSGAADSKFTLAELNAITSINVASKSISKLNGLEYFTKLATLDCRSNTLGAASTLPLTYNTELTKLYCYSSGLTGLDVSKNTKLQYLGANSNSISGTLNFGSHNALIHIDVHTNQLTGLTLPSTKTLLQKVWCQNNQLTALSPNGYTAMTYLNCANNKIAGTLSVASNSALQELYCNSNQLTGLTLPSTKSALLKLNCKTNQLTALSANGYTAMTDMDCSYNKIASTLNVSSNTKLQTLWCGNNQLVSLALPNTSTLTKMGCEVNKLTTLDVSKNTALTQLLCHNNNLTELDLSKNTALTSLNYANQTRAINAESAVVTVIDNGQEVDKKFYYFRLDNKISDAGEMPIWERMTATNYGEVPSTFLPSRVFADSWVNGVVIEGKRKAATVDEVNPNKVYGDILLLTDVTEIGDEASGTLKYRYNVQNAADPDGSKGDFTLNWTASADLEVVTDVPTLPAYREVVDVTYYNVAGMSSDRPFDGVNIIVTRYSDGSIETTKVLR